MSTDDATTGCAKGGIASGESSLGIEAGTTGTPGGDCTPGTPGKENNSLAEGIELAALGYNGSKFCEPHSVETVGVAAGAGTRGTAGTCGVMSLTSCEEPGDELGATDGTAVCTGPAVAVWSIACGMADAEGVGDVGEAVDGTTACKPAPFGIAGTRGNENKSFPGGSTATAAGEGPFSPSHEYGVVPGVVDMLVGVCGNAAMSAPEAEDVG